MNPTFKPAKITVQGIDNQGNKGKAKTFIPTGKLCENHGMYQYLLRQLTKLIEQMRDGDRQ